MEKSGTILSDSAKGRDKIIDKAYKKLHDPDDGKSANLRVAHDVLTNGAFTDEDIVPSILAGFWPLPARKTERATMIYSL